MGLEVVGFRFHGSSEQELGPAYPPSSLGMHRT